MSVAIVISTSSSEVRFLRAQLNECCKFAAFVAVTFGTLRFDGVTPENTEQIEEIAREWPHVCFLRYEVVSPDKYDNPLTSRPGAFWHNISRIVGARVINKHLDWIMFLDGDEIPDGDAFGKWKTKMLRSNPPPNKGYAFANYWYFREPIYRAITVEQSVMLLPTKLFSTPHYMWQILMNDSERQGLFGYLDLEQYAVSLDGVPMIHHYSWVRSKEHALAKVASWGHKDDKPWAQLIEQTWDRPFDWTDFVHGYEYEEVENRFDV